jgi:hypothetical protein
MSKTAKQASKENLIGLYLMPDGSWVVEDGRTAKANQYRCYSKRAVLSMMAELLDAMQSPDPTLNIENDNAEVTVLVTMQASICDPKGHLPTTEVRQGVAEAIDNFVRRGEAEGFSHKWADDISLGVVDVQTLTVE